MLRSLLAFGLFAVIALPVVAQDYSKLEVGAAYSYIRANTTFKDQFVSPAVSSSQNANLQGGKGELVYNATKTIGLVADFGGYDVTGLPNGTGASATLFTYLFGPRFTYRPSEKLSVFGEGLVGGSHISASGNGCAITPDAAISTQAATLPCYLSTSGNSFALGLGGGLDVKVATHVAIRLFEGEWFMTRFNSTINSSGRPAAGTQNNFRLAAGLQFRF
ncbi:MAG TPA: hypothetical protein VJX70_06860 [Candidatus Acidoferrum sp.]|nr:hypothetical protein [Candidatus Acidoferrum sp.]